MFCCFYVFSTVQRYGDFRTLTIPHSHNPFDMSFYIPQAWYLHKKRQKTVCFLAILKQ